ELSSQIQMDSENQQHQILRAKSDSTSTNNINNSINSTNPMNNENKPLNLVRDRQVLTNLHNAKLNTQNKTSVFTNTIHNHGIPNFHGNQQQQQPTSVQTNNTSNKQSLQPQS
ncbi:hypothetical protein C6P40_004888, partial [Pichia californica]